MKEFAFPPDCRNNFYKDFGRNQSYTEQLDPPNYGRKNSCKDNGRNNSNILQRLWSEQLDPPDYGQKTLTKILVGPTRIWSQQRPTYLCFKRKMHAMSHVGQFSFWKHVFLYCEHVFFLSFAMSHVRLFVLLYFAMWDN